MGPPGCRREALRFALSSETVFCLPLIFLKDGRPWEKQLRHKPPPKIHCLYGSSLVEPASRRQIRNFQLPVGVAYFFRRVVIVLANVRIKEGESFEAAFRRFKKSCEKAGILSDVKKREHFEKPSVRLKKKSIAARKRLLKKQKKNQSFE